jgi:hypothetical protein
VFAGEAHGPFTRVAGASDLAWASEGSKSNALDRRYKYSVFVTDANGAQLELDPFVIDTDKP